MKVKNEDQREVLSENLGKVKLERLPEPCIEIGDQVCGLESFALFYPPVPASRTIEFMYPDLHCLY